jgi:hypothetical protein
MHVAMSGICPHRTAYSQEAASYSARYDSMGMGPGPAGGGSLPQELARSEVVRAMAPKKGAVRKARDR